VVAAKGGSAMGAPGGAFLCKRGHLYHWIEAHLWWGSPGIDDEGNSVDVLNEPLLGESQRAREEGCLCGEKSVTALCHYGDVNDCLEEPLTLIGTETFRWRERIPNATDRDGNPIEAYRDFERTLEVYDVSRLFAAQEGNC